MEINSSAIGAHGARINTSSIAIVELILDSLPKFGTPARVLFTYLQGSFASNPDEIKYIQCPFEINDVDIVTHQEQMQSIAAELEKSVLMPHLHLH